MSMLNIDTNSLSALITEFRRLQAKDSITPEALGSILQRIADLLASASNAEALQPVANWYDAINEALPYIAGLEQSGSDRNNVLITPTLVNPIEGIPFVGRTPITIQSATTERAGAMRAQQVTDLNTLRNNYTELVTPAVEKVNNLKTGFGTLNIADIDNIRGEDTAKGRLVRVYDDNEFTCGYIMHFNSPFHVTQIFFTRYSLNEQGEFTNNGNSSSAFNIYKRSKVKLATTTTWSKWNLVGGDEFAEVLHNIDSLLCKSDQITALTAKAQIHVEILDGELYVFGSKKLADAGYVPYIFRHSRKRNHYKDQDKENYGPVSKGWHLYGSRHTVRVVNNLAEFSTNPGYNIHREAEEYSTSASALVRPYTDKDGDSYIPWGKSRIKLFDSRTHANRMVRVRYAIGYAKPIEHGKSKLNILNLVSNLAEFSVVFDPRSEKFVLSR